MKEYEKPLIEDEEFDFLDIVCVSVDDDPTSEGQKTDWGDIVNG